MARPLDVDVNVNVEGLPDLQKVGDELDRVGDSATKSGAVTTGVFQGIGQQVARIGTDLISSGISAGIEAIGNSITLASDKAEAANKANVLFGESYATVEAASANAATSVGLSSGAYLALAGDLGNLTTNLGFTGDEAANMSVDMLSLAADMGSFNNASTEDVVAAMGAAFRGESEPIRQFGVFLDDATVKAKAMELGLYDGVGALDANAKASATYQLIIEQTGAAQGDFAETSSGLANSQKIAAAQQEEAWTRFGAALVPIATQFTNLLTPAVEGLTWVLGLMADNIPTVIAVLIPLGIAIAATVVPPFIAWAAATLAATWPLLAIAAAVGAVVFILDQLGILDVIIDLFMSLANTVMGFVRPAIDAIVGVGRTLFGIIGQVADALRGPLDAGLNLVRAGFDIVRGAVDAVVGVLNVVFDVFRKVADMLKGPVDLAIGVVRNAFDGLRIIVDGAARLINGAIEGIGRVFGDLQRTASTVINSIVGAWNTLWSGIQRIGQQIMAFVGDLFRPLVDGINWAVGIVKDAWNGFARAWNGFQINIPKIEIPNPLGGFITLGGGSIGLPKLPTLAAGGIITAPTMLIAGEAGDEAIIPLDRMGGMGQVVNVYVEVGVGDPVAIGREIVEAIRSYERANGPAF
jgi:hypothetical protein